jgi:prepilin-type N-terminal cleavage/methylation domain-containing protein
MAWMVGMRIRQKRISRLQSNNRRRFTAAAGMTLIEIMVTLAVVGLVLGITISQLGDTFDSRARQATRELSATIRYLYNKAASENLTMRLVFDFEKQSYNVEATADLYQLENEEDREERLKREQKAKPKSETKAASSSKDATPEETPVQKAEAKFGAVDSHLLKPYQLPNGVFFKDIYTEHDNRPISKDKAYIYIFPSGYVERAIINLRNEDDSELRAIEVNPMTGATRIYEEYRELKK